MIRRERWKKWKGREDKEYTGIGVDRRRVGMVGEDRKKARRNDMQGRRREGKERNGWSKRGREKD